jgi:hypothetical protein
MSTQFLGLLHTTGLLHAHTNIASADLTFFFFVVQLIARDPKGVLVDFELFGFPPHKFIHYQDVDQATDRLPMHQSITVLHQNRKDPDDVILCYSNDCHCRLSFVYAPPQPTTMKGLQPLTYSH